MAMRSFFVGNVVRLMALTVVLLCLFAVFLKHSNQTGTSCGLMRQVVTATPPPPNLTKQKSLFITYMTFNLHLLCPLLTSLERSKFEGDVVIMHSLAESDPDLKVMRERFPSVTYALISDFRHPNSPDRSAVIDRFLVMYNYLFKNGFEEPLDTDSVYSDVEFSARIMRTPKYEFVLSHDGKDTVFQSNPVTFLRRHLSNSTGLNLIVGAEGIRYEREFNWGNDNLLDSFPEFYPWVKPRMIYNAGTLAGSQTVMMDLFLMIYNAVSRNHRSDSDQAAFNLMLWQSDYIGRQTLFTQACSGWSVQVGTEGEVKFEKVLEKWLPVVLKDDLVKVDCGNGRLVEPVVVHQFHRQEHVNEFVLAKFNKCAA